MSNAVGSELGALIELFNSITLWVLLMSCFSRLAAAIQILLITTLG